MLKYAKICQLCSLHLKNRMPGNLIKSRVFGIYWHFEIGEIYDTNTFHLPRQNPYFCLECLKIKTLWEVESDLYPCCTPILCGRKNIDRTTLDKERNKKGKSECNL